jgi:hypothetical protein
MVSLRILRLVRVDPGDWLTTTFLWRGTTSRSSIPARCRLASHRTVQCRAPCERCCGPARPSRLHTADYGSPASHQHRATLFIPNRTMDKLIAQFLTIFFLLSPARILLANL